MKRNFFEKLPSVLGLIKRCPPTLSIGHKRKLKMCQKSLGASLSQLKANCLNSERKTKKVL